MDWRLIPYSLPLLLTAALSATIALYSWRRRHNPAIVPFALLMAAIAVWLLGYGLLLLCTDLSLRLFWSNVRDLGVVATPTLWLVFTLQYTGRCHLLHRRFLTLLAVEPTLTWLILWTNDWHHLFYHSVVWDWTGPIPALRVTQYGVWFWINVFYSYALLLISTLLLLGLYHNVARPHRQRTMILLIYTFVPWLGSLLYILGVRLYYLDPTPFSFMLAGLVIGWGLLRYRLLDIAPIAYASVIAGLHDGVILLDTRNWVVDLNPAASRLLDLTPAQAVERPLAQVWPAGWSLFANRDAGEEMRASVTLQVGSQPTVCDLHVSPLRDVSNCLVLGRLLVLHDVTERQQAQEALQRARVELEKRVQERTAELLAANEALRREVEIRKRAEAAERSQRALAEALRDATSALTSPLGQDEVLDRILAGIGQVIQHEAGTIALIEGDNARVVRARGYRERRLEELVLQIRLPIARLPHLRRMAETGQPVLIPDTRGDPDWLSLPATDWIASFLGAPIRVGDQVIGFLNLDSAVPGFFSPSQIEVLQAFADQAGIALERARLFAHLRDANEQLQRAVQARDEMIQNVSHELRTPLTPIHGYIEMLESGALGALTEDQRQALHVMRAQAQRLRFMVDRLLMLQTFHPDLLQCMSLDVAMWIDHLLQAWRPRLAAAGIALHVSVADGLPPVFADPVYLEQVMDNLLDNAVKFSPGGGDVWITAYPNGCEARLVVVDRGIGIAAEDLKHLFERFYQVDGGSARRFGGLGIGLALCKLIVEAHGGRIWAESAGKGRGAAFHIALPI